jgi:hypothetical protein
MPDKKSVTSLPTFWIATAFGVFYVAITFIYQFIALPGKIAMPLSLIGSLAVWGFGLSIIASVVSVFFWKSYKVTYLPLVISAITFAFLYVFWIANGQSNLALINGYSGQFWYDTGKELPARMTNVQEFDSGASFNGDGDAELSFAMDQKDLQAWMQRTGFQWKDGPYKEAGNALNQFAGQENKLKFVDSGDVKYAFIDRSPPGSEGYSSNTTTIFVNEKDGWVLIVDSDS